MKRHNDQPLAEVLQELMDAYRWRGKLYILKIRNLWKEKMGPTVNQHTSEIKLVRKTLYLTFDSASIRQEMIFSREKIRTWINRELGEAVVEEVVIG